MFYKCINNIWCIKGEYLVSLHFSSFVDKCYYCNKNPHYIFGFYGLYGRPTCGYCYYDYCDTVMMFSDVLYILLTEICIFCANEKRLAQCIDVRRNMLLRLLFVVP